MENRQGGDRKCWPLQSLQTKRICEACTSSLFPLKEEPVSTFLCAEKLALALRVTSAVFQRSSQAPYPGEGCMLRISSFPPISLFHSYTPLPHPTPASLFLSSSANMSLPLSFLHFTILFLSPSRCFKACITPFSLSISPLFFSVSFSPRSRRVQSSYCCVVPSSKTSLCGGKTKTK